MSEVTDDREIEVEHYGSARVDDPDHSTFVQIGKLGERDRQSFGLNTEEKLDELIVKLLEARMAKGEDNLIIHKVLAVIGRWEQS